MVANVKMKNFEAEKGDVWGAVTVSVRLLPWILVSVQEETTGCGLGMNAGDK